MKDLFKSTRTYSSEFERDNNIGFHSKGIKKTTENRDALESFDKKTTENRDAFENIVKLAAKICGTSSALINFIDEEYQVTRFNVGWENKKIPKQDSICQFTIERDGLLYIPDTNNDHRLNEIEAIRNDPAIGFYAGVRFTGPDGNIHGTLCVIDKAPRELTQDQKNALVTLAKELESRLELMHRKEQLVHTNHQLKKTARFLHNSADIMWVLTPDTQVIEEVHGRVYEKIGYSIEELEGTPLKSLCSDTEFVDQLERWVDSKREDKISFETVLKQKNGEPVPMLMHVSAANGRLFLTGRDISARKEVQKQLIKEKELLDGVIDNLPGIFTLIDEDGNIRKWNDNLEKVSGYDNDEISGASVEKLLTYDSLENAYENLSDIFKHQSARTEVTLVTKNGSRIPFLLSGFRHVVNGKLIAVVIGVNISEEKRALDTLRVKEENLNTMLKRLKNAQHIAKLGSWEWGLKTDSLHWSEETYDIFQVDKEKEELNFELIFERIPDYEIERIHNVIQQIKQGTGFQDFEHDILLPDGTLKHVYERGEVTRDEEGNSVKVTGTIQDISDQKKNEDQLMSTLKEKETLLAEIHHRVKNNLAIISGLLELESMQTDEKELSISLARSITRIKSMAMIHEKLYSNEDFSNVPFDEYINDLAEFIQSLYQDSDKEIQVDIRSDEINLNINQANPSALILNELIMNAFKYAFEGKEAGKIEIDLRQHDKEILLRVKDDGVGLPEDLDPKESKSLGYTLIQLLVKQLQGELQIERDNGTMVEVRFEQENRRGSSGNMFVNGSDS